MPLNQTFPMFAMLDTANFTSESGFADLRTGAPQYAGLVVGDYFDLTEEEAQLYCSNGNCHAGRYRFVQVDSGATAAKIAAGRIGLMKSAAKGFNVVTDYDTGIAAAAIHVVVFLNAITPGNYGFVQELGDAVVLGKNPLTAAGAIGDIITMAATGVADRVASPAIDAKTLGFAITAPASNTLFRVLLDQPVVQG